MNNVNWNDSFVHSNIYDQLRSTDYANLSTHYDANNNLYLTVNNMLVSKSLQYGTPKPFNNGGYAPQTPMNGSYYFYDSNVHDTATNTYSGATNVTSGIGGFYITDDAGSNKLYIPFQTLSPIVGQYYQDQFNWMGNVWILQYSWAVTGMFIFSIYQQTGQPQKFKLNFTGRYTSSGSTDYSTYGNVSRNFNIGNVSANMYTHYRWFHDSDSSVKTTYTLIPYETVGMPVNPLTVTNDTITYVSGYYVQQSHYYGYWVTTYYTNNNVEYVSTATMQYGCTLYLQWGNQITGRLLEADVQDWIVNDLQMGANFKMCNYTSPIPMTDFIGQRITREIDISDAVMYNDSTVNWSAITPADSYVQIESNVSLDDGANWTGWQTVTNGSAIPQLTNGLNISNGFVKFRQTLYAPDQNNLPKLYDLNFEIISPVLKYLVSDGNDIKTYVYNYDWVQYPYNATGYMETDTYPTPYMSSSSSLFNTSYMAYKAFNHTNDNSYDCWASENGATSGWIKYDFGEGNSERLYKYVLSSRNNVETTSAPKSWTLQVSNDNINWITIDTQTNITGWTQAQSRTYAVTMNQSYRYYKLNITENNGNTSFVSVGELELYPLRYQVVSGSWQTIPNASINKSTFDQYGFENITDIDYNQLYLLNDVKIIVGINNLYYSPSISYKGFKKSAVRDMIKIKELNATIKNWSDYSLEQYQSSVNVDSKLIEAVGLRTVQIITESLSGKIIEKDLQIKIINDKPTITAQMINTMLKCTLSDKNNNKIRYNIKLNNNIIYPKKGQFTEWLSGTINYTHTFTSKEFVVGKINTVTIYVEDEFGANNNTLLTFNGEYGNIIFMDENGNIYNNDVGDVIQYIDFGRMFSGNISDVKKVIFKNKNGHAIKNVRISSKQSYPSDKLEFSFSNNPFVPTSELNFQQVFYPQQQSSFYIRINTNISDVTTTEMYTIKASAEPIN